MVPPGNGQTRLMHQDLDDLIKTRTPIAQIWHDDFKDGQMPDHSGSPVDGF